MTNWSARLDDLGIVLPRADENAAVVLDGRVVTSTQLPMIGQVLPVSGRVGVDIGLDQAQDLARTALLNALGAIDRAVGIDRVARPVRLRTFVVSGPGFAAQLAVADGAGELLAQVFGRLPGHATTAVGVPALPSGAPVAVELIVELVS